MKQHSTQRPGQQSGHMPGTLPLARAANLFLLSAFGLFGICVCLLVAVIGIREFHLIQQIEQQKRVDLLGNGIETYVDHRLDILYDQAEFSSIKQAVMHPEARKADAIDFMSMLSILGTKPQMVLLDFEGAEIHRTQENPDVDFTGCPWVSHLIDGTQPHFAGILHLPDGPHWCIAVPVLYHGQPEGILAAVIPLQNMINSSHLSNITNNREELKILQKETVLARFGADNAAGSTQKTVLDRFKLTLHLTGQATQISTARNHLILTVIGILLLMSLPIALATVVLVRKWFVEPLQQFRDATHSISNKTGTVRFTEQESHIQEIALLSKDLKVMAKQVDDRESTLEELVEVRTGELNTQKERLNNILEGTNVGTWEWNVQTGETIFNEKWANIIGYTLNEISPVSIDTWMKFAHPDDLKKSEELLGKHFNGELDYYDFESRMKHKDGSWIWVLDRGKVITLDDNGKPLWVSGTHQDITEHKQAEKELAKLSSAVQQSPSVITITDTKGNFEYVNPKFTESTGYSLEEAIGQNPHILKSGKQDHEIYKELWETISSGKIWHGEFHNKTKNGELLWELASISPIFDEQGKIINYVKVAEDITQRKQAEEELAETNKSLEAATAEANSMAAEAERANAAKSEFLANMSHEIRTPLNAVMGMGELLADTPLNNQQRDYLTKMNRSSKLLLGVINDVLDVSKIEAGMLELDTHSFNLYDVIHDMRSMFTSGAQKKGLEFIVKADADLPGLLVGDSMRLGQIITNLLSNALKFTESGHVSVHINKAIDAPASADFCRFTFSVTDSGIGMNEEQMGRLFKAFSQADSSTTRQYGGTGLGLVISSRLVEAMGGRLEVTSVTGEGSTFFFTIELPKASDQTEIKTVQETGSALTPSFAGYTILLVEDSELNQEVATGFITKTTAQVIVAENGKAALQCYGENSIDLVLMDLQMPVMDGFDATAEIRRRERASGDDAHVPIIALSAAVMDADRKQAAEAGVDDHLGKPIDSRELYAVMGQYLKSSGTIPGEPVFTEEVAEEFPLLDGFDPARGKASAQGKRDIYMKLLRSFNTQITGASADFPHRMSSLTFEEIHHEAHTIKGTAATVGALRVADAAAAIDRTSTEQTVPTKSMVNELRKALLSAKEQIAPHLSIEKSTLAVGEEEGPRAVETLLEILRNNELPEDDLVETVVAFVEAQAGSEKADALCSSIEQFDMDTAVDFLEKFQKGE